MSATVIIDGPIYFSQGDEAAFFGWLERIGCVEIVRGVGEQLHVLLNSPAVRDADLQELIALCHRYQIDKRPLAQFLTVENSAWFRDDRTYRHHDVFGGS